MTKRILILSILCSLFYTQIHAQQIEWKTIEQAAKTDSKSNAKLYFVDFYTTWCGWCKRMDRETFNDPVVAKILNTYYLPVKFNAEGSSEFSWLGTKYSNIATAPGAALWYFASGDNKRYSYDSYRKIFNKEIRPTMNKKLGLKTNNSQD